MAAKETYNPNYINKNFPLTLHSTVVTLCTTKNSLLCPQSAFVRSVNVLQKTSVIFVCGISQVVCSLRGTNWVLKTKVKKITLSLFTLLRHVGGSKGTVPFVFNHRYYKQASGYIHAPAALSSEGTHISLCTGGMADFRDGVRRF